MKQKIIKIGSSIGIVIPKPVAEDKGYRLGGEVDIHPEVDSNDIRIRPITTQKKTVLDPAILQWADEFIVKNRELLVRLKDK